MGKKRKISRTITQSATQANEPRLNMKQNIDTTITLKMLFNTRIGNNILIKFIVDNKIATRKWMLGQLDDENIETGGWGEIEQ